MDNAHPTHTIVPTPLNDQNDPRLVWQGAQPFLRRMLTDETFAAHLKAIEMIVDQLQYVKSFEDLATAYVCEEPGVLVEALFCQAKQEGWLLYSGLALDAAFERRYQQILQQARWVLEMR